MDIGLEGSPDGIETARQVEQRFSIPLIFVTAYTSESTLERVREVTSDGFIGKPFMDHDPRSCQESPGPAGGVTSELVNHFCIGCREPMDCPQDSTSRARFSITLTTSAIPMFNHW